MSPRLWIRVLLYAFGLPASAFGFGTVIGVSCGAGPWDVLHQGVSVQNGLSLGTSMIFSQAALLLGWIPLRQRPGLGTVLAVLFFGPLAELAITSLTFPVDLPTQVAWVVAGTMLGSVGVAAQVIAAFGLGPTDGLMVGFVARGLPIGPVRVAMDAAALTCGWWLGGTVGMGTLVCALLVGPTVQASVRGFEALAAWAPRLQADGIAPPVV